jgi:hypothetical protein
MTEPMIRITNTQGSDEANLENHSFKVRPDNCFIVPRHIADILTSDGHSGFVEHADDESTVREIKLLVSVLADRPLANSINGAILSRKLLALQ